MYTDKQRTERTRCELRQEGLRKPRRASTSAEGIVVTNTANLTAQEAEGGRRRNDTSRASGSGASAVPRGGASRGLDASVERPRRWPELASRARYDPPSDDRAQRRDETHGGISLISGPPGSTSPSTISSARNGGQQPRYRRLPSLALSSSRLPPQDLRPSNAPTQRDSRTTSPVPGLGYKHQVTKRGGKGVKLVDPGGGLC